MKYMCFACERAGGKEHETRGGGREMNLSFLHFSLPLLKLFHIIKFAHLREYHIFVFTHTHKFRFKASFLVFSPRRKIAAQLIRNIFRPWLVFD